MEINDLVNIGKLKFNQTTKKPYIMVKKSYQHLLTKLNQVFLIFKDHRVRYVSIGFIKALNEDKAIMSINDVDILQEVSTEESVGVYLEELELDNLDETYDPIGMKVYWNGEVVATIKHFFYNGAHYVYELLMHDKSIVLIPDVERFVIETNIEERYIKVVDLDQFLNL